MSPCWPKVRASVGDLTVSILLHMYYVVYDK